MAAAAVSIRWSGSGLRFEAEHASGNHHLLDGDGAAAHSPVQALILSLAACTGADVVDIAGKMRVAFEALSIEVTGDRNAEPPRYFRTMHVRYRVRGLAAADQAKLQRAIDLSHETYCSVLHSLRKDMQITSELVLE